MLKTPNPKYLYKLGEHPETPLCSVGTVGNEYKLCRSYHVARTGVESSRAYIEYKGIPRYLTEKALVELLKKAYEL